MFLVSSIRFSFKSSLVMFEKTLFSAGFKVFCTCFQNPLFLMLAFPFVGFVFPCFLFYFLLLFDKSSCNVLVFVFVVLGFLGLVMCYVFFLVFFWFGIFLEGLRVTWWGGPKGHLNWPQTLLICFVLFLVCFCLFCFSCWVLFALWFLLLFIWKAFRAKWGGPLGHLTWPLNPP